MDWPGPVDRLKIMVFLFCVSPWMWVKQNYHMSLITGFKLCMIKGQWYTSWGFSACGRFAGLVKLVLISCFVFILRDFSNFFEGQILSFTCTMNVWGNKPYSVTKDYYILENTKWWPAVWSDVHRNKLTPFPGCPKNTGV